MTPVVSIIICTYNRAEHLQQTLAAMASVRVPDAMAVELIVVDNGSTDNTAEVVKECSLLNIPVRYIHEPMRGQCYARNTGIAASQGEIILFTDDDIRPSQNWIGEMSRPILREETDAVAGGIRFAPHLQKTWLTNLHHFWLASTEIHDPSAKMDMIGANMAFRREVLKKVPKFDTELGPGALGFGDDTLFSWQIEAAGYKIIPALDTLVEHHLEPKRLRRESLLEAARKKGQVFAYLAHHWAHTSIPNAQIRPLKSTLKLYYLRLKYHDQLFSEEGGTEWELEQVRMLHYYKHFLIERKRVRNYDKNGLVKIER